MTKIFSYHKFYLDLNNQRKIRGNIAWNKVATRAGVTPSAVHTFAKQYEDLGRNPTAKVLSLENVVKLLDWMKKTDLAPYMIDEDDPDVR